MSGYKSSSLPIPTTVPKRPGNRDRSNSLDESFANLRGKASSDEILDLLESFIRGRVEVEENVSFFEECKQFLEEQIQALSCTPPTSVPFTRGTPPKNAHFTGGTSPKTALFNRTSVANNAPVDSGHVNGGTLPKINSESTNAWK